MAEKLNKNKTGLSLGIFIALIHALWAVLVAIGVAESMLDWVFPMHFIGNVFSINAFSIVNALILIVCGFVGGYVMGWVFALIWNWVAKMK